MYVVGAKVVHPCYGAGTITQIQVKDQEDQHRSYYVINTISRPMRLMVAVDNAESVGLRNVGQESFLRETLNVGSTPPPDNAISPDLRVRQTEMREWLKSGAFDKVVEVVRRLFFMNTRRPLGSVDRQMLDQGKELLAGELALSCDTKLHDAMHEIDGVLSGMLSS
ncbi:MAG: CarD family transcriptional regulator [Anaerolineae bacterium]